MGELLESTEAPVAAPKRSPLTMSYVAYINQRSLRTMIWWAVWAAASITVYASLYRDTEVWEFLEQDTSRITWLIMGLFLLGLAASFALALRLTLESLALARIEQLAAHDGLKGIDTRAGKGAVVRFFAGLKSTMEANGDPDVEALLNVELAFYQRASHTIEVVGNLLITLGLIGTVVGLTLTLTGLTSSLEALGHDQELLLSGLRKAMAGMGTAFYTTLLGAVLGGVLLRVFAQITEHGVNGLYDALMRICLVYCSADYRPSLERDVRLLNAEINSLEENVERLSRSLERSKHLIRGFEDEIVRLRRLPEGQAENEAILATIGEHERLTAILHQEVSLLRKLNRPWWSRLRAMFRSY